MALGLIDVITGHHGQRRYLFLLVAIATIPIMLVGILAKDLVIDLLRAPEVIAWTTVIFGGVLWVADKQVETKRAPVAVTAKDALLVGLMQCLAIIPGVSRAGISMTAGRLLGFDRPLSARFSLLLAVSTIAGAGFLGAYDLYRAGDTHLTVDAVIGGSLALHYSVDHDCVGDALAQARQLYKAVLPCARGRPRRSHDSFGSAGPRRRSPSTTCVSSRTRIISAAACGEGNPPASAHRSHPQ